MSTNCEDVSAHMMELLYGELPADARARVDAHVAGCARCRSELEGFEKTRAVARQGLDEAPPARARAAIMAAAAAHLAAQQAQPAPRKVSVPEKVSFWDRLRGRWAFPTLATVGAVAVFVFANRVFLNPERTLDRPPVVEAPATPAPAAEPEAKFAPQVERLAEEAQRGARMSGDHEAAKAAPAPAAAMPAEEPTPAGANRRHAAGGTKKAKKGEAGPGAFAEPPPAKALASADKQTGGQPTDRRFAPPPPPREELAAKMKPTTAAAPVGGRALSKEADAKPSRAAATSKPRSQAQRGTLDDLLAESAPAEGGAGKGSAVGGLGTGNKADGFFGSGATQAAPAPPPARNEMQRSAPAGVVAPAPTVTANAPPPPPAAPAPVSKARAKRPAAADEDYEAPMAAEAKDEKKQSAGRNATNEALLQRADRLFADGRWAEAAAVYRELLRRDPHNDEADRWRRRLVAAESAVVTAQRKADLAEKRNADADAARSRQAAPAKATKAPAKASGAASE